MIAAVCFLPKKLDQIAFENQVPLYSGKVLGQSQVVILIYTPQKSNIDTKNGHISKESTFSKPSVRDILKKSLLVFGDFPKLWIRPWRLARLIWGPRSWYTPLKTNMSPENLWLEDVFPIEMVPF